MTVQLHAQHLSSLEKASESCKGGGNGACTWYVYFMKNAKLEDCRCS